MTEFNFDLLHDNFKKKVDEYNNYRDEVSKCYRLFLRAFAKYFDSYQTSFYSISDNGQEIKGITVVKNQIENAIHLVPNSFKYYKFLNASEISFCTLYSILDSHEIENNEGKKASVPVNYSLLFNLIISLVDGDPDKFVIRLNDTYNESLGNVLSMSELENYINEESVKLSSYTPFNILSKDIENTLEKLDREHFFNIK